MGNCIAVREIANKNPKEPVSYIDIQNFLEHHKQLALNAKQARRQKLEKQIKRVQNGGYGSSEEEDKVVLEEYHDSQNPISDAQRSQIKDSVVHSGKLSRQQSMQSADMSFSHPQEKIKGFIDKNDDGSDSDVYNYNSEDELQHFFGGTKSEQKQIKAKNILSSIINQGEVAPPEQQIKTFKNVVFKKEESDEQPVGNVFSDNSFDDGKSPEFKKKK